MSRRTISSLTRKLPTYLALGVLLVGLLQTFLAPATGAQLGRRSLQLSSSIGSEKSTYQLNFSLSTAGTLGSIKVEFCTASPAIGDPCTAPTGFTASAATLIGQTGQVGFSLAPPPSANSFVLTRPPLPSVVGPVSYTLSGVTNPRDAGSYYVRIQTFSSTDASGSSSDYGAIVIAINNNLSITAEVPPYLIFCTAVSIPTLSCTSATGDYINFGELSSKIASSGTSQMLAATNAKSGYTVTLAGTTLTSGNNVITALAAADVSRPGTVQFGMNLKANASPSGGNEPTGPGVAFAAAGYANPNFYRFIPGDVVVSTSVPDDVRRFTSSYIANVPSNQAPGVYVSTVTYICLGSF